MPNDRNIILPYHSIGRLGLPAAAAWDILSGCDTHAGTLQLSCWTAEWKETVASSTHFGGCHDGCSLKLAEDVDKALMAWVYYYSTLSKLLTITLPVLTVAIPT